MALDPRGTSRVATKVDAVAQYKCELRAFDRRSGDSGGLGSHCGPFAAVETDRIEEKAAHAAADLPAHLRVDRPDPGHLQRYVAADLDRLVALGHEAASRDVAHLDLDAVPIAVTQLGPRGHRHPGGAPLAVIV